MLKGGYRIPSPLFLTFLLPHTLPARISFPTHSVRVFATPQFFFRCLPMDGIAHWCECFHPFFFWCECLCTLGGLVVGALSLVNGKQFTFWQALPQPPF